MAPTSLAPTRRGQRTRDRILDVAEELFAEWGYERTGLRDIAAEVPLRQPSLYNHFPTKAALYEAVIERALSPVREKFRERADAGASSMVDSMSARSSVSLRQSSSSGSTGSHRGRS